MGLRVQGFCLGFCSVVFSVCSDFGRVECVMRRYVMYVDPALCSIRIAVEPVKKDDEYHFEYDYDYDHALLS